MRPGPPPLVVFDFAGVVFHWQPLAVLQQCLPRHAVDAASTAHWAAMVYQGWGGDWALFDRGALDAEALARGIERRSGLPAALARAVIDAVPQALQPHAPTVALIRALHRAGMAPCYLSNMPACYADALERHNPFLHCFADGVVSARVGLVKPDPAIFDLAAQRFGRAPQDLLFFDDVAANVAAAQAAGWQARLFNSAGQAHADLLAAGITLPPWADIGARQLAPG